MMKPKKNRWVAVAVLAAAGFFFGWHAPTAHGASIYAQYHDDYAIMGGEGKLAPQFAIGNGNGVSYIQLELNITNDEQRGVSFYCPVAPNTGVVIFVYRGGNHVYTHCITSAEAAGKLGRKAVYTFTANGFGYGGAGDSALWLMFTSQGPFNAEVYGTRMNDVFYPYLVFADEGGAGSPATIGSLSQHSQGSSTTIPENGFASTSALTFSGVPRSFFASSTMELQVEVRPFDVPFSGAPTAVSAPGISGATSSITVASLPPGAYHWAARAVDVTKGYVSPWLEHRVPANIDFRIATTTAREPIVIVPGIMGSRLERVSDGGEAWPNAQELVRSAGDDHLDFLKLNADGTPASDRAIKVGDILRNVTTSFLGITFDRALYGDIVGAFTREGYEEGKDLFVAPYDWRIAIESSTAALHEKITEALVASPTGKVNIIAHSMGGLLVKHYLAARAEEHFVNKLILAGVPQLGAPKAYKLLNYGDDMGLGWLGFGLNQNKAKEIAENMPSVYELLPSRRYVDVAGGYVQDLRSGDNKILSYEGSGGPNMALSAAGDLFHRGLDGASISGGADVYNILGCLRPTITGFELYDNGSVDVKRGNGDGTVPNVSALNLTGGYHNYFVLGDETGIGHADLVRDARPVALIQDIIRGGAPATSSIPQGISAALSDCFVPRRIGTANATTVEFSTHSPVALHVYDGAGNHTGTTDSGDIERGIPGSEYEVIGENRFAILTAPPEGSAYTVVAQGLASGTFTMKAKEYESGALTRGAVYASVPLAGTSTAATLDFTSFDGNMELKLDSDGDGIANVAIMPGERGEAPSSTTPAEIIKMAAFPAIADTYIARTAPTDNFGAATTLLVDNGDYGGLVKFDEAAIASTVGHANILSAKLLFSVDDVVGTAPKSGKNTNAPVPHIFSAARSSAPWTELGATWNCPDGTSCKKKNGWADALVGVAVIQSTIDAVMGEMSFDITAEVRKLISGTHVNNGWVLKGEWKGGNAAPAAFGSQEGGEGPELVILYK